MTRIFLIRHAEAEGNIYRRAHGHHEGRIIGRGFTQIEELKKRFEREKIGAVYSSDLLRTRTTATAIYEAHNLPLNTTERLREVNVGRWEDTAWGDIEYNEPEQCGWFNSDPAKWSVEGSEGYFHVRRRMVDCISEIARCHDGDTVAVFSHGFAIRSLLCELMDVASHEVSKLPYCDNTAVALLIFENGRLSVEYHGDNSHLHSGNSTFANQTWWRGETAWRGENLRYVPLDTGALEQRRRETGGKFRADMAFAAFLGNEPVGLLGLDTGRETGENAGWIDTLHIGPEHRRNGFSIQLIGQALSEYRRLGREKLRIEAENSDRTAAYCAKYGFTGCMSEDNFVMEKDISQNAAGGVQDRIV